ncbi:hypothetical protein TRIUR3_27340 [Triticum urartu]|uniref:Uncharacterized protein n=1 Tax=Triticum urartu TaxID=4572 RepID=M7ZZU7_TRIUA|nr:uncharacterized protein LOC125522310 [Triticum urartu]EMS68683.1 hypothetical protein TRIUR3_27340 [Triticum urartu]
MPHPVDCKPRNLPVLLHLASSSGNRCCRGDHVQPPDRSPTPASTSPSRLPALESVHGTAVFKPSTTQRFKASQYLLQSSNREGFPHRMRLLSVAVKYQRRRASVVRVGECSAQPRRPPSSRPSAGLGACDSRRISASPYSSTASRWPWNLVVEARRCRCSSLSFGHWIRSSSINFCLIHAHLASPCRSSSKPCLKPLCPRRAPSPGCCHRALLLPSLLVSVRDGNKRLACTR